MSSIDLNDVCNAETVANLRKVGCNKKTIERFRFLTEFCYLRGAGEVLVNWHPARKFAWTVSMPFEEIEGGVRRAVTGWGETLAEAIQGAYENVRSGKTLGTYSMDDKRRWVWNSAINCFSECQG